MTHQPNGLKLFLYIVLLKRGTEVTTLVLKSDHDPDEDEIAKLFDLTLVPSDSIQAARYDYEHLPVLPAKERKT